MNRTRSEGGYAKGHSRMSHWSPTAEVKRLARKARRRQDGLLSLSPPRPYTKDDLYSQLIDEESGR